MLLARVQLADHQDPQAVFRHTACQSSAFLYYACQQKCHPLPVWARAWSYKRSFKLNLAPQWQPSAAHGWYKSNQCQDGALISQSDTAVPVSDDELHWFRPWPYILTLGSGVLGSLEGLVSSQCMGGPGNMCLQDRHFGGCAEQLQLTKACCRWKCVKVGFLFLLSHGHQ